MGNSWSFVTMAASGSVIATASSDQRSPQVIRDQISRVPPWIATAAFYVVAALSLTSDVPSWTGDVALGLWLAYLAVERDQVLAKRVLMAVLVIAAEIRLVGSVVGASFVAECWVCAAAGTASVAIVTAARARRIAEERFGRYPASRR
jgi:hypothetical protein